ncbi:MAG: ZIP family metal transporter [Thermodesulfobacteriota bacterium]
MTEMFSQLSKEFYIIVSVLIVSLLSMSAIFTLYFNNKKYNTLIILMISLAVGALLGEVFLHILPESFEHQGIFKTGLLALFGLLSFFVLEKYLLWRNLKNESELKTVGQMSLFADGICNFTDGFIIGAAYLVSIPLGVATTFAVCIHEIPQEIGEFGILIKSGFSKTQAIFFNIASASIAIIGALIAVYIGFRFSNTSHLIIAFGAGAYIYIIGFGLFPLLKKEFKSSRAVAHFLAMGIGLGIMLLIACVE